MSEPNALPELESIVCPHHPGVCECDLIGMEKECSIEPSLAEWNAVNSPLAQRERQLSEALSKLSTFESMAVMEIPERPKAYDAQEMNRYIDILLAKLAGAERTLTRDRELWNLTAKDAADAERRLAEIEAAAKAELPEEPKSHFVTTCDDQGLPDGFGYYCHRQDVTTYVSAAKAKIAGQAFTMQPALDLLLEPGSVRTAKEVLEKALEAIPKPQDAKENANETD